MLKATANEYDSRMLFNLREFSNIAKRLFTNEHFASRSRSFVNFEADFNERIAFRPDRAISQIWKIRQVKLSN